MARVDYYALTEAIRLQIDDHVDNANVRAEVEILFGMEPPRAVGVYLTSRRAPSDMQRLANGTRTDFQITFTVRCFGFDLNSIAEASKRRDDLIDDVENALMLDREFDGHAIMSWLDGGDFFMAEDNGFVAAGDIRLVCHAKASTS